MEADYSGKRDAEKKKKAQGLGKINAFHHKCQGLVAIGLMCQDWYQTLLGQNSFTHHKKKSGNSF